MTVYREMAGSPIETFTRARGFTAQRTFLTAWATRATAIKEILGDGYAYGSTKPWTYPDMPGIITAQVKVTPFTDDIEATVLNDLSVDINSYTNYAKIVVDYEPAEVENAQPMEDPKDAIEVEEGYLTYEMTFAGANRMIPGNAIRWSSDSTPPTDGEWTKFHRLSDIVHHWTWHRVPEPPLKAIRALTNFVNAGDFMGAADGTLLFEGARIRKEYLLSEIFGRPKQMFQVDYTFRERRIFTGLGQFAGGWQYEYRSDPGEEGWSPVVDANGSPLYATGDFSSLFLHHPQP